MEKLIYSNNHNMSLSSPIKLYKITLCTVHFGSMSEKCKNSFKRQTMRACGEIFLETSMKISDASLPTLSTVYIAA